MATELAVCFGLVPTDNLSAVMHTAGNAEKEIRVATIADAAGIWALVDESGVLDPNSCYCYLLLCRDFAETCLVTCEGNKVIAFVTAYRRPRHTQTLFVWQIGVARQARRQGLAKRLLHSLLAQPACQGVRFLEATVAPSNEASRKLFRSLADQCAVPLCVEQGFTPEMFGTAGHEEEELLRIGPLREAVA